MDSLTMLEIVMLVEQTLQVSIDNEELRDLRTVGDAKAYLSAKAKGEKPPIRSKTYRIEEIASLMPHREPFLFLESVKIDGDVATGSYKISGNEYFLEGHQGESCFSRFHYDRGFGPTLRILPSQGRISCPEVEGRSEHDLFYFLRRCEMPPNLQTRRHPFDEGESFANSSSVGLFFG